MASVQAGSGARDLQRTGTDSEAVPGAYSAGKVLAPSNQWVRHVTSTRLCAAQVSTLLI